MARVKVSNRYQIAVPSAVRKTLHIEAGDHVLIEVRNGHAILVPEPADYSEHLRGLHREVWEGVDPEEYVRGEREAWTE